MRPGREMWPAAGRLIAALAFGGVLATLVVVVGTGDLESYEHAVFSLDRGAAVDAVHAFGQPVHTLALGLGVRLPLHGNLGASPAALVAPYLPVPLTYALLLALTIAAALLIVRHALASACGRVLSWLAAFLLFCSVPMVNYTISDDWPETAVTYCALVGCVFAPHAMLGALDSARSRATRRIATLSVAATTWALLALAHPGYWPILAIALVLAAILTLCRFEASLRSRLAVVAVLAFVSLAAVAPSSPDILRDLNATAAGGDTVRDIEAFSDSVVTASNLFPFGQIGARRPFSSLILAVVSLAVGVAARRTHLGTAILVSGLASIALAIAAVALLPGERTVPAFAPSAIWALRDPAGVFAVLSGAWAAAAVRRLLSDRRFVLLGWSAGGALAIAALQGPAYAVTLAAQDLTHEDSWTRNLTALDERAQARGLAPERIPPGRRLALWPGVRQSMRRARLPSTDFADAGYLLVTAWTKQRTMRDLIVPNNVLFSQIIEPSNRVLCHTPAVQFLQLHYLLRPADVSPCAPWSRVPDLRVDGSLEVDVARETDDRIRALPVALLEEPFSRKPALSAELELLMALSPLPGTALLIEPPIVMLRLDDPSVASGQALVLPVAYDAAWSASSGDVRNVGGLLALVGADQRQLTIRFVPDLAAALRALSMTLAQALALAGILGLASVGPMPGMSTREHR